MVNKQRIIVKLQGLQTKQWELESSRHGSYQDDRGVFFVY